MPDVNVAQAKPRAFILFVQTSDAVLKHADTILYHYGLSAIKLMALQILAAQGGSMTPTALSQWTQRERHSITGMVARMKQEGLVTVEPNSKDARSVLVTLTDKGRQVLDRSRPAAVAITEQMMTSLDDKQLADLEISLKVMRENARLGLKRVGKNPG
jgi:DNA-binding MarR family transcriptional regulator